MNTVLSNRLYSRLLAVFLGLASTLPAQADVLLPSTPLQAGSIIPPNVLFVLDDSGSMAWRYMYNSKIASITGPGISSSPTGDNVGSDSSYDSTSTSNSAMYDLSYVTNGLYYNPSVDYLPWNNAAGGNQAATPYSAVYSSDSLASGSTVNLSSNTQTFYIPKPGSAGDSDALAYNRYQILTNGQIYRSELLRYTDVSTDTVLLDQSGQTATKKNWM
jgi:type IV pilus assembly protein PilY1